MRLVEWTELKLGGRNYRVRPGGPGVEFELDLETELVAARLTGNEQPEMVMLRVLERLARQSPSEAAELIQVAAHKRVRQDSAGSQIWSAQRVLSWLNEPSDGFPPSDEWLGDPALAPEVVEWVVVNGDSHQRTQLLANPHVPDAVASRLVADPEVVREALRWPLKGALEQRLLAAGQLQPLPSAPEGRIRTQLARPAKDAGLLEALLQDPDPVVRLALVANQAADAQLRERLLFDSDRGVRRAARRKLGRRAATILAARRMWRQMQQAGGERPAVADSQPHL